MYRILWKANGIQVTVTAEAKFKEKSKADRIMGGYGPVSSFGTTSTSGENSYIVNKVYRNICTREKNEKMVHSPI